MTSNFNFRIEILHTTGQCGREWNLKYYEYFPHQQWHHTMANGIDSIDDDIFQQKLCIAKFKNTYLSKDLIGN